MIWENDRNKKMKHIIYITEQQADRLQDMLNDPLLSDVGHTFSIDTVKSMDWKNGNELINYCESCNLYKLGEGIGRVVYQIDDERVIKIQKPTNSTSKQNEKEVQAFRKCDNKMKEFVPYIYDWDKNNVYPIWIIAEQVLTATYADFQKILGFDFGSYTSSADIEQMKQDLQDHSKYDGKTVTKYSFNLMEFLECYAENDLELYYDQIKHNPWLNELYTLLQRDIVAYWELENIENWGLVKRNGQPKLIILDIGI